ncbi:MAG: disulfide bond formation protein B [Ilumatobacteraceae bacterium]
MSVSAAERFFALLTLVAGAGTLLIVAMWIVPSGRAAFAALRPASGWLAWLVAATCMAGSLYFSEHAHFEPCKLCWYQRIAMYSLVVVLLVGNLRRRRDEVAWYAVPIAGIGILISIYHYVIEWNPQLEAGSCSLTAPCTAVWFREFGFISLSFMAMTGFAAVLALMLLIPKDTPHGEPTP